jgi:hypothetical protein
MLFSAIGMVFASYPGPDNDTDDDYGTWGNYVTSAVSAQYGEPTYYIWGWWWSVRYRGDATADSDMYLWWVRDGQSMEESTDEDFISNGGYMYALDYISSRTRAHFSYGGYGEWLDATAIEYVSS